jgi:uncharacterized protein (TIGR03084 family)
MEAVLTALGAQHAELDALLAPLDDAGWRAATRCEGWDVADVVLHLAQTDELALASVQERFADSLGVLATGTDGQGDVDDGAGALVARDRGAPGSAVLERWRSGAAELRVALAASDPHQRVHWVRGRMSTHTLATTRLAECWIHGDDVADAIGVVPAPTDRLEHVARLAWRTLPYAFARAGRELTGPVAFELDAPSGAPWHFVPDEEPATVIEGPGADLCLVAARRVTPGATSLRARGPDADAVLELCGPTREGRALSSSTDVDGVGLVDEVGTALAVARQHAEQREEAVAHRVGPFLGCDGRARAQARGGGRDRVDDLAVFLSQSERAIREPG